MKVKTSELSGRALDWAVAKCEEPVGGYKAWVQADLDKGILHGFHYSTDWDWCGPIIEQMAGFQLKIWLESTESTRCEAHLHNYQGDWVAFGPTPLIAAMRCYVASKLGDEVEIPEELR